MQIILQTHLLLFILIFVLDSRESGRTFRYDLQTNNFKLIVRSKVGKIFPTIYLTPNANEGCFDSF
jgi:hypothetical protein